MIILYNITNILDLDVGIVTIILGILINNNLI